VSKLDLLAAVKRWVSAHGLEVAVEYCSLCSTPSPAEVTRGKNTIIIIYGRTRILLYRYPTKGVVELTKMVIPLPSLLQLSFLSLVGYSLYTPGFFHVHSGIYFGEDAIPFWGGGQSHLLQHAIEIWMTTLVKIK
jgi:hypothetical protein